MLKLKPNEKRKPKIVDANKQPYFFILTIHIIKTGEE